MLMAMVEQIPSQTSFWMICSMQTIQYRSHQASFFLQRHRTIIILGAFLLWTSTFMKLGYFGEFGRTNAAFLMFGFLCLVILMSVATYLIPRLLLRLFLLMNGCRPDEDK